MSEIHVGTWNALNAFESPRIDEAIEIVKKMDADVLSVNELIEPSANTDNLEEIQTRMKELGYKGTIAPYSPFADVRSFQLLSLWSRQTDSTIETATFSQRHGFKTIVAELDLSIYGVHFDDRSETERQSAAGTVLADYHDADLNEAVVMGDFNAMHKSDPKSRLPRSLGRVIGGIDVDNYYDASRKIQRFSGRLIRICRMADGGTLSQFTSSGFSDADPRFRATTRRGPVGFQLDHILASAGVVLENFSLHLAVSRKSGAPLSDHNPITASVKR